VITGGSRGVVSTSLVAHYRCGTCDQPIWREGGHASLALHWAAAHPGVIGDDLIGVVRPRHPQRLPRTVTVLDSFAGRSRPTNKI